MPASYFEDTSNRPGPWGPEPQPDERPAREPIFNAPAPAVITAAVIVIAYALQSRFPWPLVAPLAFTPTDLTDGHAWTAITALFLHGNWTHAGMNAAFALAFATPVARFFGGRPFGIAAFFLFYLLCGVLGNLGFAAVHPAQVGPLVGASGAVSGLMGGTARLMGGRGRPGSIFAPVTVGFGLSLLIVNLLIAVAGSAFVPGAGDAQVAWEAHLFGFAAGLLLIGPFSRLAWR